MKSILVVIALLFAADANASSVFSSDFGQQVSCDLNSGIAVPKIKIQYGADGTFTDVSASNPLPVNAAFGGSVVIGANTAGSISNNAAVTTTAATFTAPANAVGFLLEAESSNTANVRWAIGSTATASVGTLAEPGRDTGYIPAGANISVIAISGTQSISVQWVLSH